MHHLLQTNTVLKPLQRCIVRLQRLVCLIDITLFLVTKWRRSVNRRGISASVLHKFVGFNQIQNENQKQEWHHNFSPAQR
jgi:hypothetical protein